LKNLIILILLSPFLVWQYTPYTPEKIEILVDGISQEMPTSQFDLESLCKGEHTFEIGSLFFWYWKSERQNKKWIIRTHDLDYNPNDAQYFNTNNLPYKEKIKR